MGRKNKREGTAKRKKLRTAGFWPRQNHQNSKKGNGPCKKCSTESAMRDEDGLCIKCQGKEDESLTLKTKEEVWRNRAKEQKKRKKELKEQKYRHIAKSYSGRSED